MVYEIVDTILTLEQCACMCVCVCVCVCARARARAGEHMLASHVFLLDYTNVSSGLVVASTE